MVAFISHGAWVSARRVSWLGKPVSCWDKGVGIAKWSKRVVQTNRWIAVDWGNTNLRVWVVSGAGDIEASLVQALGTSTQGGSGFEAVLMEMIEPFLSDERVTEVLCCGAIGAREGWVETPYISVPCTSPKIGDAVSVPTHDDRLRLSILPGVSQASPADVMRGEETQVAGALALLQEFDGIVCLPGTQTKWVHVSAGEIVSFQTYMTGDLFGALTGHSLLRHTIGETLGSEEAFLAAVEDGMARPQSMAARFAGLRASALLDDLPQDTARSQLSGVLIGAELAGARPYWLGQEVIVVGTSELPALYLSALTAQGAMVRALNEAEVTLAGMKAAHSLES